MGGWIGKSIVSCLIAAIAMPFSLVVLSIIIPGVTFYQEERLSMLTYIAWLLFFNPISYSNVFNIASIFIAWIIVWFVLGSWFDELLKATATIIFTLLLYLVILALYNIPLTFSNYLTWLAIGSGLVFSSIGSFSARLRRLGELDIFIEFKCVESLSLPVICPKCNTPVFSNAKYCWNCATNLEELVYKKS